MSWLQKLLPPKIKRSEGGRKSVPEGLWTKCPACESVLYSTDLENNQNVCPKCGHHHRLRARARLDLLLDPEGRFEIGAEVVPLDPLKFKDSRRYPDRLAAAVRRAKARAAPVVSGQPICRTRQSPRRRDRRTLALRLWALSPLNARFR